jgi:hypothetical protein
MVEQQQLLEKIEIDRELPRPSGNLSGNLWQGGKVAPSRRHDHDGIRGFVRGR